MVMNLGFLSLPAVGGLARIHNVVFRTDVQIQCQYF